MTMPATSICIKRHYYSGYLHKQKLFKIYMTICIYIVTENVINLKTEQKLRNYNYNYTKSKIFNYNYIYTKKYN